MVGGQITLKKYEVVEVAVGVVFDGASLSTHLSPPHFPSVIFSCPSACSRVTGGICRLLSTPSLIDLGPDTSVFVIAHLIYIGLLAGYLCSTGWWEICKFGEILSECRTTMSAPPPSSMALRQTVVIPVCAATRDPKPLHRLLSSRSTRKIPLKSPVVIMPLMLNRRDHKSEPMVSIWGSSVHLDSVGDGLGHDTRPGFPLLGPLTKEVGSEPDVGLLRIFLRHHLPVVLLGLLLGLFEYRYQRVHRRLDAFWTDGNFGVSKSGFTSDP